MHSFINLCALQRKMRFMFSQCPSQLSFSVLCLMSTPSETFESSAPFQPNLRREKTLSFMNEDVQGGEMPWAALKEGLCVRAHFIEKPSEAILELKPERHIYRILDFMDFSKFHGMVIHFSGTIQMFESQTDLIWSCVCLDLGARFHCICDTYIFLNSACIFASFKEASEEEHRCSTLWKIIQAITAKLCNNKCTSSKTFQAAHELSTLCTYIFLAIFAPRQFTDHAHLWLPFQSRLHHWILHA